MGIVEERNARKEILSNNSFAPNSMENNDGSSLPHRHQFYVDM
jgi:hypothetical protein